VTIVFGIVEEQLLSRKRCLIRSTSCFGVAGHGTRGQLMRTRRGCALAADAQRAGVPV